jgi:ribosomal protein S18 acetylase RimI-like enzyme
VTTTLRPVGPDRRDAAGGRSRAYDICVNGRIAGTVRLAVDEERAPGAGRVEELRVDPADRRRGRATVAALAAEEVLRGWGCRRVEATVPADGTAVSVLAAALGYTEHGRTMVKRLDDVAPPFTESPCVPMDAAAHADWRLRDIAQYAGRLRARGVAADRAHAVAEATHRTLLPDGHETPGMVLRVLRHDGAAVGTLWVSPSRAPHPAAGAWVYAVEVGEEHRGRGHGRTLMAEAERISRAHASGVLGLHVHADNAPALGLYGALGYRTVARHLGKPLL